VVADEHRHRRTEMAEIVISTNVSLDGVVQDPDGSEGLPFGGWFRRYGGTDLEEWGKVMFDDALDTDGLLLGRRTDAWFAERWLSRTGPWADRLNALPKYVVSSTLDAPRWGAGAVLSGDVVTAVAKLKREVDGNIVVFGSYQLGHTLIEHDLVDEVRLTVFPVVLGAGERLFGTTDAPTSLRLVDSRTIGDSLTYVTYEVVRAASGG
jgi:dihydrofolate reductase